MGGICDGEEDRKKLNKDEIIVGNGNPTMSNKSDLTKSYLSLSNLNNIIAVQERQLLITGISNIRSTQRFPSSLLLSACKNISSEPLIRYYLVYSFYIYLYQKAEAAYQKNDKTQLIAAQDDFFRLAKKFSKEEDLEKIKTFQQKFQSIKNVKSIERKNMLVKGCFEQGFILHNLNRIPTISGDPKDIGYLRMPIYQIFTGIHASYKRKEGYKREVYAVIYLTQKEEDMMKDVINSQDSCSFSAFLRGFTKEAYADTKYKQLKKQYKDRIFKLIINFPTDKSKMEQSLDFGYYFYENATSQIEKEGDVVFNIKNFFKFTKGVEAHEIQLEYGSLAAIHYKKYVSRSLPYPHPAILNIYELCNATAQHYLKSQSVLFRIFNQHQDSINVSANVLKTSNQSHNSDQNFIERENLVDNQIDSKNYDRALVNCENASTPIMRAKKLEVLYEMKNFSEVDALLPSLESDASTFLRAKEYDAYRIILFISARRKMMKKQYKPALDKLKKLRDQLKSKFEQSFQFFGRDIVQSIDECYKKMNESTDQPNTGVVWEEYLGGLNIRSISKY